MTGTHASPEERLYRRVELADPPIFFDRLNRPIVGPCLVWLGSRDVGGYGAIKGYTGARPRVVKTHRLAYAIDHGIDYKDVPELDHLCRNRACLQTHHLEPVSHIENCQRGDVGRWRLERARCVNGHEWTTDDTYVTASGARICKACRLEAGRRYEAANPWRTKRTKRQIPPKTK